jgi:hypothetical protein
MSRRGPSASFAPNIAADNDDDEVVPVAEEGEEEAVAADETAVSHSA